MNIRIMTRKAGYNFGSSLQAYAIHRVLEKNGFENQIVNYDEYHHSVRWWIKPWLKDCVYFLLSKGPSFFCRYFSNLFLNLKKRDVQKKAFEQFEEDYLRPTEFVYKTARQLARDAKKWDVCICGSDQIWSPLLFDSNFYLKFSDPSRTKLIAYAPSFGVQNVVNHRREIIKLLNRFHSISVRELAGQKIIKNLIGRDVSVLLDPTLLLTAEDWNAIASESNISQPYILCYFLGNAHIPYRYIEDMEKKLGLSVVNLTTFRTRNLIKGMQRDVDGPCDFISLIKNAQYICTDSFHASVFSILFKKEFVVFDKFAKGDAANQNSRIENLLSLFRIENCLLDSTIAVYQNIEVDYSNSENILDRLRSRSILYLNKSI